MTREPTRSRILLIIGLMVAAIVCASLVWADSLPPQSWWFPVVLVGCLLLMIGTLAAAVMTGTSTLFIDPLSRQARFDVTAGTFRMEQQFSQGFSAMLQLMVYGFLLSRWISDLPRFSDPDPDSRLGVVPAVISVAVVGVWTILVLFLVVIAWVGVPIYELTKDGIRWRTMFGSMFIPWEALYAGGPPRQAAGSFSQLPLAAARPELVRYKGIFRPRSTERPVVSLVVKTHPWLVADAIRWYAEHPEHRAGIGTQEEHDRLVSTVTADYPRPDVTRPTRPGPVTAAVWVAVAGACAGVLLAAANLYIAVAFQDRAAEAGGAIAPAIWFGLVLVGAVLTLLAAWGVWRASLRARVALLVLSGLVLLAGWIGSCLGSPSQWLLDAPGEVPLDALLVTVWIAHMALAFATGIAIIVLLLLPVSNRYFGPRYLPSSGPTDLA